MNSASKFFSFSLLVLFSVLYGQQSQGSSTIEVSGGTNLTMPRRDYQNGWGFGIDGVWNFSPKYGINLAYGSTNVDAEVGDGSRTFTSIVGAVEISFRRGKHAHAFTTIGLANVSGEDNTLFAFGIGLEIPIYDKFLIRADLRDFFSEIGIPYFSYPGGRAALQGLGESKFIELGLSVGYSFWMEKK